MKIHDLTLLTEAKVATNPVPKATPKAATKTASKASPKTTNKQVAPGEKRNLISVPIDLDRASLEKKISIYKEQLKQVENQLKKDQAKLKTEQERMSAMRSKADAATEQVSKLVDKIRTECSDYLDIFIKVNRFLYRGTDSKDDAFEGRSREERRPTDSSKKAQETFDKVAEQLGIEARRSNSIFTTSSLHVAENYGSDLYVIFPKNSAKFSWSQKYDDLVLSSSALDEFRNKKVVPKIVQTEKSRVTQEIKDLQKDLKKLNDPKIDLMAESLREYFNTLSNIDDVSGPWAISKFYKDIKHLNPKSPILTDQSVKEYLEVDSIDLKKFQKEYKLTDKDLPGAMKKTHEVLIKGEYIAVKIDLFDDKVKAMLRGNK